MTEHVLHDYAPAAGLTGAMPPHGRVAERPSEQVRHGLGRSSVPAGMNKPRSRPVLLLPRVVSSA